MKHVLRNIYHVQDRADVMTAARHLAGITRGNIGLYFLDNDPKYPCFVVLNLDKKHYTVDMAGYFYEWEVPEINNVATSEHKA